MPQTTLSDKALDHPASARWSLAARRRLVLCLNLVSILGLFLAMARIMAYGGVTPIEGAMLVAYALTLPWLTIGFWNAVIGLILTRVYSDPAAIVTPQLAQTDDDAPITSRTAIVMAIRNENPDDSLGRLEAMARDLGRSRYAEQFEYHVLSDTTRADIALEEERFVAQWRARARGAKIHYRRRLTNEGYKAGNVAEFLARCHQDYDFYLPLDADSLMGASAVERLVRVMQSDPKLGILQGLVVGTPSQTFFTRAFQFGMRNGMRSFTLGSAWWQGDCGPYWGHNALIRASAFHEYCQLPEISGRGALSGYILSHDQVEAVLMRRAGYECRVLAAEQESYEDNPPSMPDFIKRELRWCNGNLQYLRLGGLQGLK
ncbi:MAG: glucans biosynthesis glucosyltransferase MdoH, partial [Mangrovicoccus sp.]